MAIRLKDSIEILVEKTSLYERPGQEIYKKDAADITLKIIQCLHETNSTFLPEYEDLSTTCKLIHYKLLYLSMYFDINFLKRFILEPPIPSISSTDSVDKNAIRD